MGKLRWIRKYTPTPLVRYDTIRYFLVFLFTLSTFAYLPRSTLLLLFFCFVLCIDTQLIPLIAMISKPRILAVGVVLVSLWVLMGLLRMQSLELDLDEQATWNYDTRIEKWSKEDFITEAMSAAVEDDFDFGYIAEMCDEQEWDGSVVFECQNLIGGVGMTVSSI